MDRIYTFQILVGELNKFTYRIWNHFKNLLAEIKMIRDNSFPTHFIKVTCARDIKTKNFQQILIKLIHLNMSLSLKTKFKNLNKELTKELKAN